MNVKIKKVTVAQTLSLISLNTLPPLEHTHPTVPAACCSSSEVLLPKCLSAVVAARCPALIQNLSFHGHFDFREGLDVPQYQAQGGRG